MTLNKKIPALISRKKASLRAVASEKKRQPIKKPVGKFHFPPPSLSADWALSSSANSMALDGYIEVVLPICVAVSE